jgi:hypothetical protein
MVKISNKPVEELVILEMVEYNIKKLAETCAILMDMGRPVILNWAEGVAFHHTPLPFNTKELLRERMKGKIFWATVMFASMPVFNPSLKVGARDIPVLATPNPVLKQVARWMKERLGKNRSQIKLIHV